MVFLRAFEYDRCFWKLSQISKIIVYQRILSFFTLQDNYSGLSYIDCQRRGYYFVGGGWREYVDSDLSKEYFSQFATFWSQRQCFVSV